MKTISLGVNVDHVATVREARGVDYPDPLQAAQAAERGGARGITIHLREDRRHIQDSDVRRIGAGISTKLNLELAIAPEVLAIACELSPADVCVVPEKREELTTEGGLAVAGREAEVRQAVGRLTDAGIRVSLFIDPDLREIEAAAAVGAPVVELHTGTYANATTTEQAAPHLEAIRTGAERAAELGLVVNAGHGLTLANVGPIAAMTPMEELNIGHSIVGRALMVGMEEATREMLAVMTEARS